MEKVVPSKKSVRAVKIVSVRHLSPEFQYYKNPSNKPLTCSPNWLGYSIYIVITHFVRVLHAHEVPFLTANLRSLKYIFKRSRRDWHIAYYCMN